jgi:hypothetical protein
MENNFSSETRYLKTQDLSKDLKNHRVRVQKIQMVIQMTLLA